MLEIVENHKPNLTCVQIDDTDVWFSYHAPIAYNKHDGDAVFITENIWGVTTGRHMKYIAEKFERVYDKMPFDTFIERLQDFE